MKYRRYLLRLDAARADHLTPRLGFRGHDASEVGGRARKRCTAEGGKPRLDFWVGNALVDLLVQLVDDVGGRVPGSSEAKRRTRFVSRDELGNGRNIR